MMIPCIDREALKLLVGTADERFQYSPEYFRKTHFPQIMHRFYKGQLTAEVTEQELLYELKEVDSSGNRVYFIFGSTGAGKSELLCWLKDMWETSGVDRPVIRISRSELNPQILIKKCYESIGVALDIKIDETRWDLLLKKPITLINQLVWTTLAEFLESDEEIVPIALLIRPIIEKNITDFTKQVEKGSIKKPLEIITVEQFQEIITNTTVQIPIEYSLLEQSLVHKLDRFLFEGWEISALFKHLSKILKEQEIRPLLLIDDLVQSVNIYATEILDHLITLEEGNWDVVIGLTPGALQDNARGSELTERIQNLDTFDDRVRKLWLSDESGKAFYNLDRLQAIPYMSNYMKELKSSRGFQCSQSCGHFNKCKQYIPVGENNEYEEIPLLPLNKPLIKRMFDGIPVGKSKLRYMILNAKEIVRFLQKGNKRYLDRIHPLVSREVFADHQDTLIKSLAEWYSEEEVSEVTLSPLLLKHFGYGDVETIVKLHPLETRLITEDNTMNNQDVFHNDDHRLTIRDWVEGKVINKQLLEPVRLGITCLVNDVVKATLMSRKYTPRASAVIQRKEIENRSRYPIVFSEEQDNKLNIGVSRSYSALQISNFQSFKPSDKGRKFLQISNELNVAQWIYQADELHGEWKKLLELELGITLPKLALELKSWVNQWRQVGETNWASSINTPFTKNMLDLTEEMFQDWYILRDNMVDYNAIQYSKDAQFNFESWLMNLKIPRVLEQYQSNNLSLYVFFSKLQEDFRYYRRQVIEAFDKEVDNKMGYLIYLDTKSCKESQRCKDILKSLASKVSYQNLLIAIGYLNEWYKLIDKHGFKVEFEEMCIMRAQVLEEFERFKTLEKKVMLLCKDITDAQLHPKIIEFDPGWINLKAERNKWVLVAQSLEQIQHSLSITPRNVVRRFLEVDVHTPEVRNIKLLWSKIYGYVEQLQYGIETDTGFKECITTWETTDFYKVNARWIEQSKRDNDTRSLLDKINKDYETYNAMSLEEAVECINNDDQVRPAVKRQLINLLERGYSSLPPSQWRKLVEELAERFPTLFESVRLQLVFNKENKV